MKILGIVLVVAGLVLLAVGGLPYKQKRNVAEVGGLKMTVTEERQFAVPPIVSGILVLAGAALIFAGRKRNP